MAQQFKVPQFIEHEARIVGPLTLKQTGLLSGMGAILFVLWFVLQPWLFFLLGTPLVLFVLFVSFLKINDRPIIDFFSSFFSFFISPQLYIWQKQTKKRGVERKKQKREIFEGPSTELTGQEVKELAKKLDKY